MTEKELNKAVAKKLKEYGIDENLLTKEEMEQLREEVRIEEEGGAILDGVLSNFDILMRGINSRESEI